MPHERPSCAGVFGEPTGARACVLAGERQRAKQSAAAPRGGSARSLWSLASAAGVVLRTPAGRLCGRSTRPKTKRRLRAERRHEVPHTAAPRPTTSHVRKVPGAFTVNQNQANACPSHDPTTVNPLLSDQKWSKSRPPLPSPEAVRRGFPRYTIPRVISPTCLLTARLNRGGFFPAGRSCAGLCVGRRAPASQAVRRRPTRRICSFPLVTRIRRRRRPENACRSLMRRLRAEN
jgi:hypothetical protein